MGHLIRYAITGLLVRLKQLQEESSCVVYIINTIKRPIATPWKDSRIKNKDVYIVLVDSIMKYEGDCNLVKIKVNYIGMW